MKKNMLKNRKKKGFTLIELIAVIAILGILIAVIAPRMTGYTDSAKLSKTKANVKTLVTAIEVFNSTAESSDVEVDEDATIAKIIDGKNSKDKNLKGDEDALDSLHDIATAVLDDALIDNGNTYANLKDALEDTKYGDIETELGVD